MLMSRHRKHIWQNSTSIHDKNSHQSWIRGNISQHNVKHVDKPRPNIMLNGEKLKPFPLN